MTRQPAGYVVTVELEWAWTFAQVMIGGLVLGTLLNVVRPRDGDEPAVAYRNGVRRALAWLHDRLAAPGRRADRDRQPGNDTVP